MEIARGAARGMNWLHQSKPVSFIHRDLKTGNLLVRPPNLAISIKVQFISQALKF